MTEEHDPFDIANLTLSPETVAKIAVARAERTAHQTKLITDKIEASRATGGKKPKRDADWFIQVLVRAVIAGAKATRDRRWVVWLYVHYRVGREHANTVEIGSKTLREWGVSRHVKIRALRHYEQAGLWTVEWRGRKSPMVTVRLDLCRLR